jgi:hypothetical protein
MPKNAKKLVVGNATLNQSFECPAQLMRLGTRLIFVTLVDNMRSQLGK